MSFRAWILATLLLPIAALAEDPVLTARPGLCIIQNTQQNECVMGVQLSWEAPVQGDYCLHHSIDPQALYCWQDNASGEHRTELYSREDVSYWLQRPGSESQLAKITVRVVSLAQRNTQRRRRRHPWSVL